MTEGETALLVIHEAAAGAYDRSPRLREIAAEQRRSLPVRVIDAEHVLDPDRPFRLLMPNGDERRVAGDRIAVYRDGVLVEERRLPWLDRVLRRALAGIRLRRLRRRLERGPGLRCGDPR